MNPDVLSLRLQKNATLVENHLREYYKTRTDNVLSRAEQYSLFAGGKRIRPTLVLEWCRLFGGNDQSALPFASALEMIHTYSLIHDDLPCMDNDDLRRGKPTNHKVFGYADALLAGDSLLTEAFGMAVANEYVTPNILVEAVSVLSSFAGGEGMVGGQVMDLEGEHKKLTLDELLQLHSGKTGALITASCVLGALASGVSLSDSRMQNVVNYAENVGLVFQIVDDILDVTGSAETLGKNVHVDSSREKNTFLSFYTLDEAKAYAKTLTQKAIASLLDFPEHDVLQAIAEYLLERKN